MGIKEIGGYFGLEQFNNREYYSDLIAVNSARNALVYLLRAKNIRKVYLPYFLCESVAKVCEREGCDYEYYSIDKQFSPIFSKLLNKDEYLYVVNYYGQLKDRDILNLKKRFNNLIVDNVQAFYQKPLQGIDTIYSCRKFFGVPDGAYLSTDIYLSESIEIDESRTRMTHILGRFEKNASDYYEDFKRNDLSFVNEPLRLMSPLTHNLLGVIDYLKIKKRRNDNYKILERLLGEYNSLSLKMPQGAYCYPLYCKNGMAIKKMLAGKGIYVATLWPNVLNLAGTIEKDFAENILPLPCDQRYDEEDMKRIVEEVLKCMNT